MASSKVESSPSPSPSLSTNPKSKADSSPFSLRNTYLATHLQGQIDRLKNDPAYNDYTATLMKDGMSVYLTVPSSEGKVGFVIHFPYDYPFKGPELITTTHPSLVNVSPFEETHLQLWDHQPSYRLPHYIIELHAIVTSIIG